MDVENIEYIKAYIKQNMSKYRYKHTLGVANTAKELANIYGINESNAMVAALLHDLAKESSNSEKRKFCKEHSIPLDEYLDKNISLSHGIIAAYIAKDQFDIQEEEVLLAISNHTLGRKNMCDLEKIIYLADIIEPSRSTYPGLESLRKLAYQDLNKAMQAAIKSNIDYLNSSNKQIHPIIYDIFEDYKEIQ